MPISMINVKHIYIEPKKYTGKNPKKAAKYNEKYINDAINYRSKYIFHNYPIDWHCMEQRRTYNPYDTYNLHVTAFRYNIYTFCMLVKGKLYDYV